MAELKIKLKRRNGASYDTILPEITTTEVLKSDGTALSTFSSELLVASQDGSNITFVTGDADGGFNLRTASDVLTDFSIASASYATGQCSDSQYDDDFEGCITNGGNFTPVATHNQSQDSIFACYITGSENQQVYQANRWSGDSAFDEEDQVRCETAACSSGLLEEDENSCISGGHTWWEGGTWTNLSTALGNKAGLDGNNKLLLSQLPVGVNIKAMKFAGPTGELGVQATPKGLSQLFTQLDDLGPQGVTFLLGDYFIVTATSDNWVVGDSSAAGDVYQFRFGNDADDLQNPLITDKIQIEAGDRIVFTDFSGSQAGSYIFNFSIINVNNNNASTSFKGLVALSSIGQTLSGYNVGATDRHLRVVDEKSLRDAMKDQRRIIEFTGHTGTSKLISYYVTDALNLPAGTNGQRALVGAGTTKDVYEHIGGSWQDTLIDATFPANAATFPTFGTEDAREIVFYDAEQLDYLYVSATANNVWTITKELNTLTSSILPVDGDLVYWISP
jgi:hypothetical protein